MAVDRDQETPAVGEPTPIGIRIAGGVVLVVGAAMLAAVAFAPTELPARALLVAVVVGAYAAVVADLRAVAAVAALAAATFVGFLAHHYGDLTGAGNAWSYVVLIGLAAVLGTGYRYLRSINADDDEVAPLIRRPVPGSSVVAPPDDAPRGPRAA
ncbi:hypothetical protein [Micromonospora globispora]|uniref:hypothetical protein n=1 Tax=Micromonospora globispora TaxID=1450148 RepID=UPI000F4D8C8B|nr:hypothetical protein [Micromonospora globispora]